MSQPSGVTLYRIPLDASVITDEEIRQHLQMLSEKFPCAATEDFKKVMQEAMRRIDWVEDGQ